MEYQDVKKRLTAVQNLLAQPTLNLSTLQSVQTLISEKNGKNHYSSSFDQ